MSEHAMLVNGTKVAISKEPIDKLDPLPADDVYEDIHCISTTGVSHEVGEQEEVETTTLCSGGYREYLLGFKDSGSLGLTIHYKPSDPIYKRIKKASDDGKMRAVRITFPDGSTFISLGSFKRHGFGGDLSGTFSSEVKIKLSGAPVETTT